MATGKLAVQPVDDEQDDQKRRENDQSAGKVTLPCGHHVVIIPGG
jgi:hypothetical protein